MRILLCVAVLFCGCGTDDRAASDGASGLGADGAIPTGDGASPVADAAADQGAQNCGHTQCGTACVDLTQDPLHCGSCDHACQMGQVCQAGACQSVGDCRKTPCSGLSYCDLASGQCKPGCVTTSQCQSTEYCEPTGHQCTAGCDASSVCPINASCDLMNHQCTCKPGALTCGGACAVCPMDSHAATFGCSGSQCVVATCSGQTVLCGGACVDTARDSANCGVCGHACSSKSHCSNALCQFFAGSSSAADSCDDVCTRAGGTCYLASWCYTPIAGCSCMGVGCWCDNFACATKGGQGRDTCSASFTNLDCTCNAP